MLPWAQGSQPEGAARGRLGGGEGKEFSHSWSEHTSWGPCPRPGFPLASTLSPPSAHSDAVVPRAVSPLRLLGGNTQHPPLASNFVLHSEGRWVLGRRGKGTLEAFCFHKCELSNSAILGSSHLPCEPREGLVGLRGKMKACDIHNVSVSLAEKQS